jgi:hypothetical protein
VIEQAQAEAAPSPKKRPSQSTPNSRKVGAVLHKAGLQYILGRIVANDAALEVADLAGNVPFLGLNAQQKSRAIEVMAGGCRLHTIKLEKLDLGNEQAAAVARLLRSRHPLQAFSLEGNNFTEAGVLAIAAGLHNHSHMQEVIAITRLARPAARATPPSCVQTTDVHHGSTSRSPLLLSPLHS